MCCSIEKVAEGTYIVPTVNTIEILIKLAVMASSKAVDSRDGAIPRRIVVDCRIQSSRSTV